MFISLPNNVKLILQIRFPKESIFDPEEAPACKRAVMQPIYGTETENKIGGTTKRATCLLLHQEKL